MEINLGVDLQVEVKTALATCTLAHLDSTCARLRRRDQSEGERLRERERETIPQLLDYRSI